MYTVCTVCVQRSIRFSGSEKVTDSFTIHRNMKTANSAEPPLYPCFLSLPLFAGKTEHNVPNVGRRRRPGGGQQAAVPGDVRPAFQQCQVRKPRKRESFHPSLFRGRHAPFNNRKGREIPRFQKGTKILALLRPSLSPIH